MYVSMPSTPLDSGTAIPQADTNQDELLGKVLQGALDVLGLDNGLIGHRALPQRGIGVERLERTLYLCNGKCHHLDMLTLPLQFLDDCLQTEQPCVIQHPSGIQCVRAQLPAQHQPGGYLIVPLNSNGSCFAVAVLELRPDESITPAHLQRLRPIRWAAADLWQAARQQAPGPGDGPRADAELQRLHQAAREAMLTIDAAGRILTLNPAAEHMLRCQAQQVVGQAVEQLLPGVRKALAIGPLDGIDEREETHKDFSTIRTGALEHDTRTLYYSSYTSRRQGGACITLLLEDHSRETALAKHYSAAIQRFKTLTDATPIGLLHTNQYWECIYVNEAWCRLSGLSPEESYGHGWISALYFEDANAVIEDLSSNISAGQDFKQDLRLQTPLGALAWVQASATPARQPNGTIHGFIAAFTDITPLKQSTERLQSNAENDTLTGLSNRHKFQEELAQALHRADRRGPLALLYLDLDGFKCINDSLGHAAGDSLLYHVARRLEGCLRNEDTVARLGGDEFTIILEALHDSRFAAEIADKIVQSVSRPVITETKEVYVTACIGIAIGGAGDNAEDLLKQADIALYRAKALGPGSVRYFTPEMVRAMKQRVELVSKLRGAIERQEFELYYQPQVDLKTGRVVGNEALLRWRSDGQQILQPVSFVPHLEETGLIESIAGMVLQHACRQHQSWRQQGLLAEGSTISVNFSARQFHRAGVAKLVHSHLQEFSMTGSELILEITESLLLDDNAKTQATLSELRELGVRIALDDFGTGYSALSYLTRFPIDYLKIDRSFVHAIIGEPKNAAVAKAIIALGHQLGLQVIAEGVDSAETLDFLKDVGCDFYQGYYFCEPRPATSLSDSILRGTF